MMDDDNEEDVFPEKKSSIERTITLIRPEPLKLHRDAILEEIKTAGFEIVKQKELTLTKEQGMSQAKKLTIKNLFPAETLYDAQKEEDHFETLISEMTSGPCLVLCLAKVF